MTRTNAVRIPVALALAMLIVLSAALGLNVRTASGEAHHQETAATASLHDTMRVLWEDHVFWTRLYIISFADDLPDKDSTAERLLQNQVDIGNALVPYYGEEAGAKLTELLQDHILGAVALLEAAKSGDQTAIDLASTEWYANSDAIAAFLNSLNPDNWPLDAMTSAMKMHLDQTLVEATARLTGDYAADIAAFDEIRAHILLMADLLTQGIEAQFPSGY